MQPEHDSVAESFPKKKMKTLLVLTFLVIFAFGYLRIHELDRRAAAFKQQRLSAAAATTDPIPTATPPPSPRHARFGQLSLVRGEVSAVREEGVLVDCAEDRFFGQNWVVSSRTGAGEIAQLAGLASREESKEYGETYFLYRGKLVPANNPRSIASGRVLLKGYPYRLTPGEKIKVVALRDDLKGRVAAYTMEFISDDLPPEPAPQPVKQLFPDTMTAEQRRAELQSMTEERLRGR